MCNIFCITFWVVLFPLISERKVCTHYYILFPCLVRPMFLCAFSLSALLQRNLAEWTWFWLGNLLLCFQLKDTEETIDAGFRAKNQVGLFGGFIRKWKCQKLWGNILLILGTEHFTYLVLFCNSCSCRDIDTSWGNTILEYTYG